MTERGNRFDLSGRVALVTGSSRGLGRAIALGLAEAGARVACVARSAPDLERLVADIRMAGSDGIVLAADVTDLHQARAAVEQAMERLGRLDVLVNNAGVGTPTLAVELEEPEWDLVMDTNLKASFFLSQAAARAMLRAAADRGDADGSVIGRVINVSSMMGVLGGNRRSVYCASKGGLDALTRALAVEWARHPILVNAVAPGYVETDMTAALHASEKFHAHVLGRTPLGRWGVPEDLVGAVIYLASTASDFVTGTVLHVDGGWVASA